MRADPGCQTKVAATPSANIVRTRLINYALVPIVYLPVQPATTFEFIINLKTAKCPQTKHSCLTARTPRCGPLKLRNVHLLRCMSFLLALSDLIQCPASSRYQG